MEVIFFSETEVTTILCNKYWKEITKNKTKIKTKHKTSKTKFMTTRPTLRLRQDKRKISKQYNTT